MKNVLLILKADFRALSKQFFAMVIVIAILFIPALYAWFNIFSNWDPYGNTGNITIAVASDDKGYEQGGVYENMGETVLASLAEKDTINFVVYDNSDDALWAMESGEAYAAIILNEDFTRNMYDLAHALRYPESTMTYYENYKLNAVANKITESAASTVNKTVQTQYLEVFFETVFDKIDSAEQDFNYEETERNLTNALTDLRDTTKILAQTTSDLIDLCNDGSSALNKIQIYGLADDVVNSGAISNINTAAEALEAIDQSKLNEIVDLFFDREARQTKISEILQKIDSADIDGALTDIQSQVDTLNAFADSLPEEYAIEFYTLTDSIQEDINEIRDAALSPETQATIEEILAEISNLMDELEDIAKADIVPYILLQLQTIAKLLRDFSPLIVDTATTIDSITPLAHAGANTLTSAGETLAFLQTALNTIADKLDGLLDTVQTVSDSEVVETLLTMMGGDSNAFAEFFSCPITVNTITVFPIGTYGTAMAPFYSTLAIWVGCVVLAAVIKVHANGRDLKNVTSNQLYWSRFIIYLLLSEIQTFIIFAGDLWLLGIHCNNPGALFLCAGITSFVFVAFIYSLVVSFGDIGKAIVVIIMVLQIAGSSGTYPIEILSDVFEKFFLLFPFPYAINAMREAIAGMYGLDMYKYLGELMIFGVMGIMIGIFVRKPFMEMNEFIEEEMEETGVL